MNPNKYISGGCDMELALWLILMIIVGAFIYEYVDSTLGMGYGTTLTPVLLLVGFSPMQVVPAILLSELISGILAGIFHHFEGNVDFKPKTLDIFEIKDMIKSFGFLMVYERLFLFTQRSPCFLQVAVL
jgi:hypothetical protein